MPWGSGKGRVMILHNECGQYPWIRGCISSDLRELGVALKA